MVHVQFECGKLSGVGMNVSVTTDPVIYERECKAAGLSWPDRAEGQPRSAKMGLQGEIEKIEKGDSLVCISNLGAPWVLL